MSKHRVPKIAWMAPDILLRTGILQPRVAPRRSPPGIALSVHGSWVTAILVGLLTFVLAAPPSLRSSAASATSRPYGVPPLASVRKLIDQGDYAEAEALARSLLADVESASGPDSVDTAEVLDSLVEALWRGGRMRGPEARALAERSLGIKQRVLGADHPGVATSLDVLGDLLAKIGSYGEARECFEKALRIQEKELGPEHLDVARTLDSLGVLLCLLGDYSGSKELLQKALGIRERLLGADHPATAQSMTNLGYLRYLQADYAGAESLLQKALEIRQKVLGPDHPDVAASLYYLAAVRTTTGDYLEARPLRERALAIYEKRLGPEHPNVAACLNGLAVMLRNAGEFDRAKDAYERVLSIWEKTLGPDHPNLAAALNNLAELRGVTGDYAGAKQAYERALEIKRNALGPEHPGVGTILNNLADVLTVTGEFAQAKLLLDQSLAIRIKVYGPDHPEVARTLSNLAELLYLQGEPVPERSAGQGSATTPAPDATSVALDTALRAETIGREHLRLTIRTLPERQALRFAVTRASGLDVALSLAARGTDSASTRRTWDALIRSRALVLDEMASRHRSVGEAGDPEISQLSKQLASARQKLAKLSLQDPGSESFAQRQAMLEDARRKEEQSEQLLSQKSALFRGMLNNTAVGWEETRSSLPSGSALVAYARYRRPVRASNRPRPRGSGEVPTGSNSRVERPEPTPSYLALVLRSDRQDPFVAPLGSAEEVDELVRAWAVEAATTPSVVEVAGKRDEARYRQAGARLRHAIWDPVARVLGRPHLVFVVPDGTLNLVSLASLPTGERDYLVQTGSLFQYLSAERDLVPLGGSEPNGRGLLALGGPEFDGRPAQEPTSIGDRHSAEGGPASESRSAVSASYRGTSAGCAEFQSMRFLPLPASRAEADDVVALWRNQHASAHPGGEEALVLTGSEAGEVEFKAKAPGHRLLHLATHAFFVDERKCPLAPAGSRSTVVEPGNTSPSAGAENPLLLTGLALAGANSREASGAEETDDGILTAEEIASLDLSGVEWVVLSACDTGLGRLQSGEGVLGLRRAFQIAGVRSLIMSLWRVEDWTAHDWMEQLYKGRLSGLSTAEAVRNASLEMLRARRRSGKSSHPYYWGAFVAAGAWQ